MEDQEQETVVSPPASKGQAKPAKSPRVPLAKGRGGTAGIFAGVAVIAPVLIREIFTGSDAFILLPLSLVAVGIALSGFRVAQAGRDGNLGRLGLTLAGVGLLLITVLVIAASYRDLAQDAALQSGLGFLRFGFILFLVGLVLFGAATLRAGVLGRGPTLMMMVSLPLAAILQGAGVFPGGFSWSRSIILGQGIHYGLKIFGLSLIWLGYSILKDTKAKSTAAAREA